mgnify:FL=1
MKNRNPHISALELALEAMYTNRPQLFRALRHKLCHHEEAEFHPDGWVIHCPDCLLTNEPHEPINPMDMREGK